MKAIELTSSASPYYDEAVELYLTAFPESQRVPILVLQELVDCEVGQALVFLDGDIFVGAAFAVFDEETYYLMFFAIDSRHRSKGYGHTALNELDRHMPDRRILLEMEHIDPAAPNNAQRIARERFYLRNGFNYTDFASEEDGELFDVLVRGQSITQDGMLDFLMKIVGPELVDDWGVILKPRVQQ